MNLRVTEKGVDVPGKSRTGGETKTGHQLWGERRGRMRDMVGAWGRSSLFPWRSCEGEHTGYPSDPYRDRALCPHLQLKAGGPGQGSQSDQFPCCIIRTPQVGGQGKRMLLGTKEGLAQSPHTPLHGACPGVREPARTGLQTGLGETVPHFPTKARLPVGTKKKRSGGAYAGRSLEEQGRHRGRGHEEQSWACGKGAESLLN